MNDIKALAELRISMGQTPEGALVLNFHGVRFVPGGQENLGTHEVMALVMRCMDQWHCAQATAMQDGAPKLAIATGGIIN